MDPVEAFVQAACVPREGDHLAGTLEQADFWLAREPAVASHDIVTAAILGEADAVRRFVTQNGASAVEKAGPYGWDPLTYLCFSRYLRLDPTRSEAFVQTAKVLLEAGAPAQTGWIEMIDHPNPHPILESAIYGAAALARHPQLTQLLLDNGADPNDDETPYHVPEGYDNAVLQVLLESGKLNETSLSWMLVRKADWHDEDGMRLVLQHGANPNLPTRFRYTALQHAVRRDNQTSAIALLLDYGADPTLANQADGRTTIAMAAHRGRGDLVRLFEERGIKPDLAGVDRLIASCAKGESAASQSLAAEEPTLLQQLAAQGGTRLVEFANNGNTEGVRCLLDLGLDPSTLSPEHDPYIGIAKNSTALHAAAWRAWPLTVAELIHRGANVHALDAQGRTPLFLAVKACTDSYWTHRRTPDSVAALLKAGASPAGIAIPTGYAEIDALLSNVHKDAG